MIRILKINSVLVLLVVVLFSIIILGTTVFAAEPSGTGDPPSTGGAATTVTYESPIKATNFPAANSCKSNKDRLFTCCPAS